MGPFDTLKTGYACICHVEGTTDIDLKYRYQN